MKQIKLLSKERRLSKMINLYGDIWNVINEKEMPCFNNNKGILIESLDKSYRSNVQLTDVEFNIN